MLVTSEPALGFCIVCGDLSLFGDTALGFRVVSNEPAVSRDLAVSGLWVASADRAMVGDDLALGDSAGLLGGGAVGDEAAAGAFIICGGLAGDLLLFLVIKLQSIRAGADLESPLCINIDLATRPLLADLNEADCCCCVVVLTGLVISIGNVSVLGVRINFLLEGLLGGIFDESSVAGLLALWRGDSGTFFLCFNKRPLSSAVEE